MGRRTWNTREGGRSGEILEVACGQRKQTPSVCSLSCKCRFTVLVDPPFLRTVTRTYAHTLIRSPALHSLPISCATYHSLSLSLSLPNNPRLSTPTTHDTLRLSHSTVHSLRTTPNLPLSRSHTLSFWLALRWSLWNRHRHRHRHRHLDGLCFLLRTLGRRPTYKHSGVQQHSANSANFGKGGACSLSWSLRRRCAPAEVFGLRS